MALPRMILTGASGFLGRHLLDYLKDRWEVFAIARRSPLECRVSEWPGLRWFQVDIGEASHLKSVFDAILQGGGVDVVVHLAAHYDFTGEDHPEYWRTNVGGLRNVLELCKPLRIRRFFFASSVAASRFPPPGAALNEDSPPDGEHIYAVTKRVGEEMLREYGDAVPSTVIRFGAMYSDWCEYPPLYKFLETWLSRAWNARILGGKGLSAIPYFHIRDAVSFFKALLERYPLLAPGEVLVASTSGCTTHRELFQAATRAYFGREVRPLYMPRLLCGPGMAARDLLGRLTGERPFERPWMARYIDLQMTTDASRTYERLGWKPKDRLDIVRRMPFLVENFKSNPGEWHRLNHAAMKEVRVRTNLQLHRILEQHEEAILRTVLEEIQGPQAKWSLRYRRIDAQDLQWNVRQLLRHLTNAVLTREKAIFRRYCRDLAQLRYRQGFGVYEVVKALETTRDLCVAEVAPDAAKRGLDQALQDHVAMTFDLGIDEVQDVFEEMAASPPPPA